MSYEGLESYLKRHGVRHFTARELSPRVPAPGGLWQNILPTVHVARLLREKFGPIGVNSGYRDALHNAAVGGTRNSLHVKFNALDLRSLASDVVPPEAMWDYLRWHGWNSLMGIGLYTGFLHIDTRVLVFGMPHWFHDYRGV